MQLSAMCEQALLNSAMALFVFLILKVKKKHLNTEKIAKGQNRTITGEIEMSICVLNHILLCVFAATCLSLNNPFYFYRQLR